MKALQSLILAIHVAMIAKALREGMARGLEAWTKCFDGWLTERLEMGGFLPAYREGNTDAEGHRCFRSMSDADISLTLIWSKGLSFKDSPYPAVVLEIGNKASVEVLPDVYVCKCGAIADDVNCDGCREAEEHGNRYKYCPTCGDDRCVVHHNEWDCAYTQRDDEGCPVAPCDCGC